MTVKELITELKKYDMDLPVGIGNIDDDSDGAIVSLDVKAISKEQVFDDFENKYLDKYFLAIGYRCSLCGREE